jgi:hypothetical protein
MPRRLTAVAALWVALGVPAVAAAQQDPNPATTAPTATATPTTSTPAATPGATTPGTAAPGATTTAAPATTPPPATTPAPAPVQTNTAAQPTVRSGNDRAAVILLLMVAVLVLFALVLWALARWQAWEPSWLVRWRHATGEAGWRAGNAWSEFTDWLRLGR